MKRIIGPYLMCESSFEDDTCRATDLIVLKARDMMIACRVRRHGYAERWGHEFTVRAKRENGTPTELDKIINGWGDWMFYGHASEHGASFDLWSLIDLHALRSHMIRRSRNQEQFQYEKRSNKDGATHFIAFDMRSFPKYPPLLIAQGGRLAKGKELTMCYCSHNDKSWLPWWTIPVVFWLAILLVVVVVVARVWL